MREVALEADLQAVVIRIGDGVLGENVAEYRNAVWRAAVAAGRMQIGEECGRKPTRVMAGEPDPPVTDWHRAVGKMQIESGGQRPCRQIVGGIGIKRPAVVIRAEAARSLPDSGSVGQQRRVIRPTPPRGPGRFVRCQDSDREWRASDDPACRRRRCAKSCRSKAGARSSDCIVRHIAISGAAEIRQRAGSGGIATNQRNPPGRRGVGGAGSLRSLVQNAAVGIRKIAAGLRFKRQIEQVI